MSEDRRELVRKIEQENTALLDLRTIDEYQAILLEEMNSIDAQLSAAKSQRRSEDDYQNWRGRILNVRNKVLTKYQELKRRGKELRQEKMLEASDLDPANPCQLVHAAHGLLHRLKSEGVELDRQELAVLVALDRFVETNPI